MRALIYLKEVKQENLLADVELEVVPRGIYQIDGIDYQYTGQPKFIIKNYEGFDGEVSKLLTVEFTVEKV